MIDGDGDDMNEPAQIPPESVAPVGHPFNVRQLSANRLWLGQAATGRRTRSVDTPYGHAIRAAIPQNPVRRMSEIALAATLQAAAVRTGPINPGGLEIETFDLRRKVRAARTPNFILFVVDASGSMAARQRMTAVKGAILSLLLDAYQKRDSVALIAFRGSGASLLLPPTNSVSQAHLRLTDLPAGGRTPLADGLTLAQRLLHQHEQRDGAATPLMVLLSDGRANVAQNGRPAQALAEAQTAAEQIAARRWSSLVIDCESGYPRLGLAQQLARSLKGECIRLEELSAEVLAQTVRRRITTNW